eukprot:XP_022259155.1 uncharacterized protein LOC111090075 isoform X1 [Canis lupus familiaris]
MPGEHPTRRGQAQVQVRAGEQVALSAGSRGADSELQLWQVKAAGRTGSAPICPACVLSLSRADSGAAWRRPNTGDPSESAGVRPRAPACGSCCLTDLRAAGVVGLRAAVQPGGRPQTSCSGYCPREPPGAPRRLSFRTGSRIATVPRWQEWKRFLWGPWKPDVKKESTRWREKTLSFCHWKEERYSTRNIQRSDCYVSKK